jgi:hypothetical protein
MERPDQSPRKISNDAYANSTLAWASVRECHPTSQPADHGSMVGV